MSIDECMHSRRRQMLPWAAVKNIYRTRVGADYGSFFVSLLFVRHDLAGKREV